MFAALKQKWLSRAIKVNFQLGATGSGEFEVTYKGRTEEQFLNEFMVTVREQDIKEFTYNRFFGTKTKVIIREKEDQLLLEHKVSEVQTVTQEKTWASEPAENVVKETLPDSCKSTEDLAKEELINPESPILDPKGVFYSKYIWHCIKESPVDPHFTGVHSEQHQLLADIAWEEYQADPQAFIEDNPQYTDYPYAQEDVARVEQCL